MDSSSETASALPRLAIVIGAMRAGTTTLYQMLQDCPTVCLSRIKEPDFFIAEKSAYRGAGWYASLFPHRERVCIDISPNYAKNDVFPGVAEAIAAYQPRTKIIYIVRDPVARAESEYFHQLAAGVRMPPPAQLIGSPEGCHILSTSSYGKQIASYYAAFPRDQILVVDMEALISDPQTQLSALLDFLGVQAGQSTSFNVVVANDRGSLQRVPKVWLALRRTRAGDFIRDLVPPKLQTSLKSCAASMMRWRRPKPQTNFSTEVRRTIRDALAADIAYFRAQTGMQPPSWLAAEPVETEPRPQD